MECCHSFIQFSFIIFLKRISIIAGPIYLFNCKVKSENTNNIKKNTNCDIVTINIIFKGELFCTAFFLTMSKIAHNIADTMEKIMPKLILL